MNKYVHVAIFTHSNVNTGEICFEENDLMVIGIDDGEDVTVTDFRYIFQSICDIDTTYLKKDEWYKLTLKRKFDDDGSGAKNDCYFVLIETKLIESDRP